MARVNVYIDGFNFYYGVARGTPYRWLDLGKLSEGLIRKEDEVHRIRYFTARVRSTAASVRQNTYLRALETVPDLSIHEGHFLTHAVTLPLTDGTGMARVDRTEEKGSDVNLASYLLFDAFDQDFETALVISNDSDLVFPVSEVRRRFDVAVGVAAPVYHADRHPTQALVRATDFNVHITRKRRKLLRTSQFPNPVIDAEGRAIYKPAEW